MNMVFLKCYIFYIVHQKLSQPPEKIQTTHTGVGTPRLKNIALKHFQQDDFNDQQTTF